MSKPMEDPPSLLDVLAREHTARRLLIEAEAHALATRVAEGSNIGASDTQVDELTKECSERRAALEAEARRG